MIRRTHPTSRSRKKGGFTLIEVIIAGAVALALVAGMYSAFSMYFTSFRKEQSLLDRSRELQEILSKLREDFSTSRPELITPDDFESLKCPLQQLGYRSGPQSLLEEARDHVVYHMIYEDRDATQPSRASAHAYYQKYSYSRGTTGWATPPPTSADWLNAAPEPPRSRASIPGGGAAITDCFIVRRVPVEGGFGTFFVVKARDPGLVVWSYISSKEEGVAGRLLRWSPRTGLIDLGHGVVRLDALQLRDEWIYVREKPPQEPEQLFHLRTQLEASVSLIGPAPGSPSKPGVPELTMEAAIPREI